MERMEKQRARQRKLKEDRELAAKKAVDEKEQEEERHRLGLLQAEHERLAKERETQRKMEHSAGDPVHYISGPGSIFDEVSGSFDSDRGAEPEEKQSDASGLITKAYHLRLYFET